MEKLLFVDGMGDDFTVENGENHSDGEVGGVLFAGCYPIKAQDVRILTEALVDHVGGVEPSQITVTKTAETSRENFNLTALAAAADFSLIASFRYAGSDSEPIQPRSLIVDSLTTTSKGDQIVVGYDEDRSDVRSFRVDRIKGFVQVSE